MGDWCKETTHLVSFTTLYLRGFKACHTASWSRRHQSMLLKCQILPSLHCCHGHFPCLARMLSADVFAADSNHGEIT